MHTLLTLTGRARRPRISISSSHRNLRQHSVALFHQASPLNAWEIPETYARNHAAKSKMEEMMDSLSRARANPSRVWNVYLELGSLIGFEGVPFEMQQQVLRKCVPRTDQLRIAAARRMQTNNQPRSPHIYELRLQTLIGHIRASGRTPTLDDYHFVLEQFAAVGHQNGARHVFRELIHLGIEPSYRTYGLCLQAIAHRLTLPCPFRFQPNMRSDANSMCNELLDDMWTRRIPITSVNFDLVHRVFKETEARDTYERLLQVGYGIDLSNPDRPPLNTKGGNFEMGGTPTFQQMPQTLPFSTAALNTLIDMLGKTKQISRMVMAFEVFTTPLPPPPGPNSLSEDEEDDDPAFYQFSPSDGIPPYEPPSATPNTTTFNLLIRYASKANHAVFARHYVVQAMQLEREKDAQLRAELAFKPLETIPSPHFAVNRGSLLPPFGLANRTRHFAFLRWSYRQAILARNRKKNCLAFYTQWRKNHAPPKLQTLGDGERHNSDPTTPLEGAPESPTPSSSSAGDLPEVAVRRTPVIPELSEALQVDLDASPPVQPQPKMLNLDLHIELLTRDVEELSELVERMRAAVERLSQRVKERLGRRVWQGKDIFLMSRNQRVHVNRREWMEMVRFRQPREDVPERSSGARPWPGRESLPHLQNGIRRHIKISPSDKPRQN